jgi:hypothetical protein
LEGGCEGESLSTELEYNHNFEFTEVWDDEPSVSTVTVYSLASLPSLVVLGPICSDPHGCAGNVVILITALKDGSGLQDLGTKSC